MAEVIFYEKPGCINNTQQKKLLRGSGHTVIAYDLLGQEWSKNQLRRFLAELPVSDWFNMSAPAVKNGVIDVFTVNGDEALELMLDDPLLIRRPLMQVKDMYRVGFDAQAVHDWIGLEKADSMDDLESCPRLE